MNQRIIKFRCWDKDTKTMLDDIPPSSVPLGANAVICGTTCDVMQFTGLLDKNGKEVWEGDILKDDVGCVRDVRFGELPLDKSGDCVCTYPAFYAHYEKALNGRIGYENECSEIAEWMEIIGNIYQDSHLLNNK